MGRRPIDPIKREQVIQVYHQTGSIRQAAKVAGVSYPTAQKIVAESRFSEHAEDERLEASPETESRADLDNIFVKILKKVNEALDEGIKPSSWRDLINAVDLVVRTRSEGLGEGLSEEEQEEIQKFLDKVLNK